MRRQVVAGCWGDLAEQRGRASPQGNKVDALPVEPTEIAIGGQAGIENQLPGPLAGALLPKGDKIQNGVILLVLTQTGVGIAKHLGVGVLREEGQAPPCRRLRLET